MSRSRRQARSGLLSLVRKLGWMSIEEACRYLKVSKATAHRILADLLASGVIRQTSYKGPVGRPRLIFYVGEERLPSTSAELAHGAAIG